MGRKTPVPEPAEEREEPTGAEMFDEEVHTATRLADLAGTGGSFEGDTVTLEAIENEEVTVLAFRVMPSKFNEGEDYVCFQARMADGKVIVVNTSTKVPVKAFQNIDPGDLPAPVTFFKQTPKGGGNPYWNLR
jgi:hypothetical protein